MNIDELKFIFQYFDIQQFLEQNHPAKLGIILVVMILLTIIAHFLTAMLQKKIVAATGREASKNAANSGAADNKAAETERIDIERFDRVIKHGRQLMYIFILGWGLKQLNVGPVYSEVNSIILTTIGTFIVLLFLSTLVPFTIDAYLRRRGATLQTSQTRSLMPIIQGMIWAVGLTFLLDNVGFHVSTIIAGLGIVGVAVGLAGQAILADFFSYIVILLDRPFRVGDFIVLSNGKSGEVVYMGPKTTRLRNLEDDLIVCANSEMTKGILVNQGSVSRRIAIINIGVEYATPMSTVRRVPDIMKEVIAQFPQCYFQRCVLNELGSANFIFQLIYEVASEPGAILQFMETRSAVTLAIQQKLDDEKIAGAYPTERILVSNLPQ